MLQKKEKQKENGIGDKQKERKGNRRKKVQWEATLNIWFLPDAIFLH